MQFPTGGTAHAPASIFLTGQDSVKLRSRQYSLDERRLLIAGYSIYAVRMILLWIVLHSRALLLCTRAPKERCQQSWRVPGARVGKMPSLLDYTFAQTYACILSTALNIHVQGILVNTDCILPIQFFRRAFSCS